MTAKNPEGPYSEPIFIKDAPGIDPSLSLMMMEKFGIVVASMAMIKSRLEAIRLRIVFMFSN